MKALVTIEERKEFWRYEPMLKWFRKNVGENWISKVLDMEEGQHGKEARDRLGAYLLRMHQIQTRIWMEHHPRTTETVPLTEGDNNGVGQ